MHPRKAKHVNIYSTPLLSSQKLFCARISPFSTKSESLHSSVPLRMLLRKIHQHRLPFLVFPSTVCLNMALFCWQHSHGELPGGIQLYSLVQHTAAGNLLRWDHATITSALTTPLWHQGWETSPRCFWTVEHAQRLLSNSFATSQSLQSLLFLLRASPCGHAEQIQI